VLLFYDTAVSIYSTKQHVDKLGRDLEGSSHDLIEALTQKLPRGPDKSQNISVRIVSVPAKRRTKNL
jgi:hypothetical protein